MSFATYFKLCIEPYSDINALYNINCTYLAKFKYYSFFSLATDHLDRWIRKKYLQLDSDYDEVMAIGQSNQLPSI